MLVTTVAYHTVNLKYSVCIILIWNELGGGREAKAFTTEGAEYTESD
jgi:hypothetical protein